ncbi:MAG: GNAT family N-acetyltransferase [Actinomycetota bacterium]|nr:GNAT family N-acetyltransferase [Actinomycetota bacterium]
MEQSAKASLRPCRAEEAGEVLNLWRSAGAEPSHTDDEAGIRGLIERDPDALLVAELDGRLVGTLIAAWDGWRANLYRLAVSPEFRRQGLGRRLLVEGERRLRSKGARRITALVHGDEGEAVVFWHSVGYAHDEEIRRYVKNVQSPFADSPAGCC